MPIDSTGYLLSKQVYMIILVKNHNCLLPTASRTEMTTAATRFADAIGGPNFKNLDIVKFLNRMANLNLIGRAINLERIGITRARKMHTLLCYQRFDYYVIFVQN